MAPALKDTLQQQPLVFIVLYDQGFKRLLVINRWIRRFGGALTGTLPLYPQAPEQATETTPRRSDSEDGGLECPLESRGPRQLVLGSSYVNY